MPEKRKNLSLAIAIYSLLLINNAFSLVTYVIDNSEIALTICSAVNIVALVAALIVDIVKKRQGGLGLSLMYILATVGSVISLIYTIKFFGGIDNSYGFLFGYVLEIVVSALPIIFIIIFFAKPNRACQILATIFIAILLMLGIYSMISVVFSVMNPPENYTYTAKDIVGMFLPRVIFFIANILAIAQLFVSVKFTKKVMPQPVPQYAPVQPVYQYPPQQYAQPTQPIYQPPVQQYPQQQYQPPENNNQ